MKSTLVLPCSFTGMYKLVELLDLYIINKKQNFDIVTGFVIYTEVAFSATVVKFSLAEHLSVGMIRNEATMLHTEEKIFFDHNGTGVVVVFFPRTMLLIIDIYTFGKTASYF